MGARFETLTLTMVSRLQAELVDEAPEIYPTASHPLTTPFTSFSANFLALLEHPIRFNLPSKPTSSSKSSTSINTAKMFIARSEYDRGINTFSPEGRLFQVEYSLEAIKLGSTAIGISTSEGVILGVEKRITSSLLETSSVEKIVEIDWHIGCAMSGLQADARSMIEHARISSQSHEFHYAERLGVESCTQAICDLALRFGEGADGEESIMSRPFGVALLIAGYDEEGPSLYECLHIISTNCLLTRPF